MRGATWVSRLAGAVCSPGGRILSRSTRPQDHTRWNPIIESRSPVRRDSLALTQVPIDIESDSPRWRWAVALSSRSYPWVEILECQFLPAQIKDRVHPLSRNLEAQLLHFLSE